MLQPAAEGGVTEVLIDNRSLGEDSSEMTLNHGVYKYAYGRFISEQFGCNGK